MKTCATMATLLAIGLLSAQRASAQGIAKPSADMARLQGGWEIQARCENGTDASSEHLKGCTVFFGRGAIVLTGVDKQLHMGLVKLNGAEAPKAIDVLLMRGPDRGTTLQGIYKLEGDSLILCLDPTGSDRPKEFTAPASSGHQLLTCKRLRTEGDKLPDLSGDYRSTSTELDGSKHTAQVSIERAGDAYVVTYTRRDAVAYVGMGIRKGEVFAVSWLGPGQAGLTMYEIQPGPRLVGQYTQLGGPGILNQETLTRNDAKK